MFHGVVVLRFACSKKKKRGGSNSVLTLGKYIGARERDVAINRGKASMMKKATSGERRASLSFNKNLKGSHSQE